MSGFDDIEFGIPTTVKILTVEGYMLSEAEALDEKPISCSSL
jgi:hypothetical protein